MYFPNIENFPEFKKIFSPSKGAKIFLPTLSLMLCPLKIHTHKGVSTISESKTLSFLYEY